MDIAISQNVFLFLLGFLFYLVAWVLPGGLALYGLYFLLTLPLRRRERARLFLHVLELGLRDGRTPEETLRSASASRDRVLGARFHLVAAHLARGLRLGLALQLVPRLVPTNIAAMIEAGERLGDLRKVLPACREALGGAVSQTRSAQNYLVMLLFGFTPVALLVPLMISTHIVPKFQEVYAGLMGGAALPAFTRLVLGGHPVFTAIQFGIIVFLWAGMVLYVGGPRLTNWLQNVFPGLPGRMAFLLPWKRARFQRDFSATLALLLDAAVPEAEALQLAGRCTGNSVFAHQSQAAAAAVRDGTKLTEAVRRVGKRSEFQWRLSNAVHRGGGFVQALAGWHETLEARAFQLEQSAAQLITTALLLLNGLIIGSVVLGLFLPLIHIIQLASVW